MLWTPVTWLAVSMLTNVTHNHNNLFISVLEPPTYVLFFKRLNYIH